MKQQHFPAREHKVSFKKKKGIVKKVLELTVQELNRTEIASELKISYGSVRRYLSPDFNPIHGKYNTICNRNIKPDAEKVNQILKEKHTFCEIEQISNFVNEIRRDISAARKAIELDYNNGLAEGSVK